MIDRLTSEFRAAVYLEVDRAPTKNQLDDNEKLNPINNATVSYCFWAFAVAELYPLCELPLARATLDTVNRHRH